MTTLTTEQLIFLSLDSFTMATIIIGNVAVILTLVLRSNLKTTKNSFILSLAVADLCVGMFIIPNVMTIRYTLNDWKKFLCLSCYYLECVSASASVFTISAMAIDRFRALMFPVQFKNTNPKCLYGTLVLVWTCALIYGTRIPFVYDTTANNVTLGNNTRINYACIVPTHMKGTNNILIALDCVVLFAIPALLLLICNVIVSVRLQNQKAPGSNQQRNQNKKTKAIRFLLIMIAAFIVCHLPLFAFRLHKLIYPGKIKNSKYINYFLMLLSWINSILNILFYGSLNDEIKANLTRVGQILKCIKHSQVAPLASGSDEVSGTKTKVVTVDTSIQ